MIEYFQQLLTLGAILVVFLGIFALVVRFALAPLLALTAIPAYAAMIGLEWFISENNKGKCPAFLQFKRPKTFWKKLCMDFFAAYCTFSGGLIASKIFSGVLDEKAPSNGLLELVAHSADSRQFMLVAMFWMFLIGAYAVSHFQGDEPGHPINKLEDQGNRIKSYGYLVS